MSRPSNFSSSLVLLQRLLGLAAEQEAQPCAHRIDITADTDVTNGEGNAVYSRTRAGRDPGTQHTHGGVGPLVHKDVLVIDPQDHLLGDFPIQAATQDKA